MADDGGCFRGGPARPRALKSRVVRPTAAGLAFIALLSALLIPLLTGGCSSVPQRDGTYRLPASHNFRFYQVYPEAARSFYAAHYAHFGTYETLLRDGEDAAAAMEALHDRILHYVEHPPKFEPPAEIIAPEWSKLAYETGQAMDWTHMLHSQLYDILTDDRVREKRATGDRAIGYYLSNGESAFATRGYGHRWMEGGGPWAGEFRRRHPRINGILWAYHWHHAAVYEALMEPDSTARRRALDRVIRVFRDSVLQNPPRVMPLTAEIAPGFSRVFPAAAHIFDNLHMMHDVANDIMADPSLDRVEKAAEIERMRRNMLYRNQGTVVAPAMPMHGEHGDHPMGPGAARVPTRLPDGAWLPQGHPEARRASMEELSHPLEPPRTGQSGALDADRREGIRPSLRRAPP